MARAPRMLVAHVVSHTHWDRAWYWTFEESRLRLLDLLDDLLELLERDPGFRHFVLDGQLAMVLDYLALRPEVTHRIGQLVRKGRLCLGPFFVLPDLFIPRGESLVRNLRLGRATARALGPVMALGYLPDPFGLPAQLPQILRGFGIDGVFLSRGVGDEGQWLGSDFHWRSPDGSEVLATHQLAGGYCNLAKLGDGLVGEAAISAACERIRGAVRELAPSSPSRVLLLSNGCDHLPAQPELPALLAAAGRRLLDEGIVLRHSTPVAYQRAVRRAIAVGGFRPALHQGELRGSRYANLLPGVLSSRVDLKLALDTGERELLHWSEPFSAIASLLETTDRDPSAALEHAWRLLLLCQPHDDICGCSIDAVHRDDENRLARAGQVASELTSRALSSIAARVPGKRERSVVVFNPHPFSILGGVELASWRGGVDGPEGALAAQRTARGVLAQVELPPLGWLVLTSSRKRDQAVAGAVRVRHRGSGSAILENDRVRVTIARDGALELLALGSSRQRHRLELCDEGDAGDTYDFSPTPRRETIVGFARPPRIQILEQGPLRGTVEIAGHLLLPVGLARDRRCVRADERAFPCGCGSTSGPDSSFCSLELAVENTVDEHRLRLRLRSSLRARTLSAGAPFEVSRRPLSGSTPRRPGWVQQPSPTVPLEAFAAIEERGRGGLALLAPGLHELEAHPLGRGRGTELQLTLLRSVRWLSRGDLATRSGHAGPGLPVEGARQLGLHRFRLGLLVYHGGWARAGVPRAARVHASPPRVVEVVSSTAPTLPARGALLAIEPASVELSALEAGPQVGTLIARLINPEAGAVRARLLGPFRRARRLRLDGTPLPGRVDLAAIELGPAEICTLRLELDADTVRAGAPRPVDPS